MKQFSAALILLLALGPLRADGISNSAVKVGQDGIYNPNTGSGSLWVLPGATTDCYWSKSLFFGNCALTVSRTTTNGTATNLLPTSALGAAIQAFANNVPRITFGSGVLIEESRTNFLLNSVLPATQITGSLATGTYTLWVNGTGTATMSLGTGVGCGLGAATQGNPVSFTLTVAGTCIVTVTGLLNAFQLELNPGSVSAPLSLIVTTAAVGVRGADVVTLTTPPILGSAYTEFGSGTPEVPTTYATSGQVIISIDATTLANRLQLQRQPSTGLANAILDSGNVVSYNQNSGAAWAQATLAKVALASTAGTQNAALNGTPLTAGTGAANPVGATVVHVGVRADGVAQWDGYVARIALWPNTALSSTSLQTVTTLP